jgi:hypothetical protein
MQWRNAAPALPSKNGCRNIHSCGFENFLRVVSSRQQRCVIIVTKEKKSTLKR